MLLSIKSNTTILQKYKKSSIISNIKKSGSCYHIVSFLLNLSNKQESDLTRAITKSVISLDKLARSIDSRIDNFLYEPFEDVNNLSVKNIQGLEVEIIKCLSFLENEKVYKEVLSNTMKAVERSFEFNTTKRHLIYDLKSLNIEENTTMGYLFPVLSLLNDKDENLYKMERIFRAISTYIQILDDYVDLIEDVSNFSRTPISDRYWELLNQKSAFQVLSKEFICKACNTYFIIETELKDLFDNKEVSLSLFRWNEFQKTLNTLNIPDIYEQKDIKEFLDKLKDSVPPMLCYT